MVPSCVVEPCRDVQLRNGCLLNRVGVLEHVEVSLYLVRLPVMVGPPQCHEKKLFEYVFLGNGFLSSHLTIGSQNR